MKQYNCTRVEADRYGGDWPVDAFAAHGIAVEPCPRNRSECYLELLPALTAQRVELLDDERMLRQFLALERRAGRLRDVVDHPPGALHHDDCANAAAIALLRALDSDAVFAGPCVDDFARTSPWSDSAEFVGSDLG